jgi:hypothetical protein
MRKYGQERSALPSLEKIKMGNMLKGGQRTAAEEK